MKISEQLIPSHFYYKVRIILSKLNRVYNNQYGGDIKEKLYDFDYNGKKLIFKVAVNNQPDVYIISVVSTDELDCIIVVIEKSGNIAILENLVYYKSCAKNGLMQPGGGNALLQFIYFFLKAHKKVFNINKLVLSDRSMKYCKNSDKKVILSRLKMVTDGKTWYHKNGYIPYNQRLNIASDKGLEKMKENRTILKKLEFKHIDIKYVIELSLKNKDITNNNIDEFNKIMKKHKNYICPTVYDLSKDLDKWCGFINNILDEIFAPKPPKKAVLFDFYQKTLYKDL